MRVIAGRVKKRRLKSPGKLPVRPTADRVKESLFNILGEKIPDHSFMDLYAGTGGVGIEALSRGARKVLFVEKDPRVLRLLKENIALTGLEQGAEVIPGDVTTALRSLTVRPEKYDIIFADPPYRQGLAAMTLNTLAMNPVWQQSAIIVMETGADEEMPAEAGLLKLYRREKYGDTALYFYTVASY